MITNIYFEITASNKTKSRLIPREKNQGGNTGLQAKSS